MYAATDFGSFHDGSREWKKISIILQTLSGVLCNKYKYLFRYVDIP